MELVSVIIPTYKGSLALERAINSVLNQSYTKIEVIIVDDNAPESLEREKTEKIMRQYERDNRVKYIKHPRNLNGSVARNTGISYAIGTYISFLDDDDYYLQDRIERCVHYLSLNKSIIGVYVGVDIMDADNNVIMQIRPRKNLEVSDLLMKEMVIGTGSNIFLKKDSVNQISGFDTSFVRRQDIEFMVRICQCGIVGFIEDKLIIKSVNGTENHPGYFKMKETLEHFFTVFSKEIDNLGNDKAIFYARQYRTLLNIALYEHNKTRIIEARSLICEYDKLSLKEKILIFMYIHNIRNNRIVISIIRYQKFLKSFFIKLTNG